MNKKAELNAVAIIVLIVFLGLAIFFIYKYVNNDDKQDQEFNVTQINDSATSTATQYVSRAGGINITGGTDLTLRNNTINISVNDTNLTLVKVIYPNRTMTPGDIMSTNITEICVSGYSDTVRNVSQHTRETVFIMYKLSPNQPEGSFEVDHLVPLSIGGSNNIKNLWPQPKEPRPGYKEKDVLENYYHRQVCDGKMDIREAQAIMANNWFQGYLDAKEAGGIK